MIKCSRCNKEIATKKDIVFAQQYFCILKTYHAKCYSEELLGFPILLSGPMNTPIATNPISLVIGIVIIIVVLAGYLFALKLDNAIDNPMVQLIAGFVIVFLLGSIAIEIINKNKMKRQYSELKD